jgi:selenide,water dikinase
VETVPLTSLAKAGGCAAKYSAARLEALLAGFVPAEAEDLLVGLDPADDAAVYRLDDERALVFTVDFFPPLVDDPRAFGAIAATNALNDVFAMGGAPLLALSIAAFPEELPTEVLGDVLAGADERVRAAGALLAGGHTIRDSEPKYGLAVVGTVHPDAIWPKAGARVGDALFLTKPLGTGIVLQAHRDGKAPDGGLAAAVAAMHELSRAAAEALRPFVPNAVTDVTGFGLLGHLHELASRSGVRAIVDSDALPSLPSALNRGSERADRRRSRNREFASRHVGARERRRRALPTPHRRQAAFSSRCPPSASLLEATFRSQDLFLARIGHVEGGSGVVLRYWRPSSHAFGSCLRVGSCGLHSSLRSRYSS